MKIGCLNRIEINLSIDNATSNQDEMASNANVKNVVSLHDKSDIDSKTIFFSCKNKFTLKMHMLIESTAAKVINILREEKRLDFIFEKTINPARLPNNPIRRNILLKMVFTVRIMLCLLFELN